MAASTDALAQRMNLDDLRVRSLERVVVLVGVVGYVWLTLLVWPITRGDAGPAAWVGVLLLLASVTLSHALRHWRLQLASMILILGTLGAVACAMLGLRSVELAYLFVLPVLFASMLWSQAGTFTATGLAIALMAAVSCGKLGAPIVSRAVAMPAGVLVLAAVASWQTAHNLYVALDWVWSGYRQAHRNERRARDQQADLRRALKALDEATYRLERANYMLGIARDQAEEARRLKQQFAQTISHELRTPLNLVVGFTDLIVQSPEYYGEPLPAAYVRDLSIVHRNARHLQSLVNDVLDLARIEAAQMSLTPEETDPSALMTEAVNTARSLVESRGLALQTDIEPGLPTLWLDPTRIRQVLFNLLNNAARFTEEGAITVSARRQGGEVIFGVADTGIGIPPQDTERIFDEFRQVDSSRRRQHGGAGLGLAICKRFVQLHSGRIWVESEVGRGATFLFALPIDRREQTTEPLHATPQLHAPAPEAGGPRELPILLAVTGSPAGAALISRYVQGYRTVVLQDLEQAHQAAQQLLPQGVIIDTGHQPLSPGELQQLAQEWAMPRTPFVACPLPGEESLLQRLNVEGYLLKPVSQQSLWDVLRRLGEKVDRVLVIDDDRDFVGLMERLLESPLRRYEVSCAYSGHEGLEMIQHEEPDLVLLDMVLPDMNGIQIIDRIRANPLWRYLPIVVVSAQGELDSVGAQSGTMHITKAAGLLPGEIVRWTQHVFDTAMGPIASPANRHHSP